MNLNEQWYNLAINFWLDKHQAKKNYIQIVDAYSGKERFYHTLQHIDEMLCAFSKTRNLATNPDVIEFAIWFHDFVYLPNEKENETKSARYASKVLRNQTNLPKGKIQTIEKLILASQYHFDYNPQNSDFETLLFLDLDLLIFSADTSRYSEYQQQVRKEYSMYEDSLYFEGRKKVLNHFLEKSPIYKTPYFQNRYEQKAVINIKKELATLS